MYCPKNGWKDLIYNLLHDGTIVVFNRHRALFGDGSRVVIDEAIFLEQVDFVV